MGFQITNGGLRNWDKIQDVCGPPEMISKALCVCLRAHTWMLSISLGTVYVHPSNCCLEFQDMEF